MPYAQSTRRETAKNARGKIVPFLAPLAAFLFFANFAAESVWRLNPSAVSLRRPPRRPPPTRAGACRWRCGFPELVPFGRQCSRDEFFRYGLQRLLRGNGTSRFGTSVRRHRM